MLFKSPSYLLYGFLLFSIPSAFADGTQPLPSLADEGLPDAEYDYGMRLINGHDYKQDPVAGRQWIEKAAKQGKTEAETQLGKMCLDGEGVPANVAPEASHDYKCAKKWLKKAAEQDNLAAKNKLAGMYRLGMGVPVDTNKALDIYKHLCEKGQQTSCFAVSDISEKSK